MEHSRLYNKEQRSERNNVELLAHPSARAVIAWIYTAAEGPRRA
jgi:hypothetical protein